MELLQEYVVLGGIYDHPRCRICYDWANETADVSSGDEVDVDTFHKAGAQRSHSVVRTKAGEELFTGAVAKGYLEVEKIGEEDIARNVGFIIKKIGNIPRIEERRRLGLPLPKFGNFPFYNMEI
jgi:coenzyme F420-reducing hydrogenase beta subunit